MRGSGRSSLGRGKAADGSSLRSPSSIRKPKNRRSAADRRATVAGDSCAHCRPRSESVSVSAEPSEPATSAALFKSLRYAASVWGDAPASAAIISRNRSTSARSPSVTSRLSRTRERLCGDHPGGEALPGAVERGDRVVQMRGGQMLEPRALEASCGHHQDTSRLAERCRAVDHLGPPGPVTNRQPMAAVQAVGAVAVEAAEAGEPGDQQRAALLAGALVAADERVDPAEAEIQPASVRS